MQTWFGELETTFHPDIMWGSALVPVPPITPLAAVKPVFPLITMYPRWTRVEAPTWGAYKKRLETTMRTASREAETIRRRTNMRRIETLTSFFRKTHANKKIPEETV